MTFDIGWAFLSALAVFVTLFAAVVCAGLLQVLRDVWFYQGTRGRLAMVGLAVVFMAAFLYGGLRGPS